MQSRRTGRRWGSVRLSARPAELLPSICLRDLPFCGSGARLWLAGDLGTRWPLPQGAAERRWPGAAGVWPCLMHLGASA